MFSAKRCSSGALATLLLWSFVAMPPAQAQTIEDENTTEPTVIEECLVIGDVGSRGRTPLHSDAIEKAIVEGKWVAPKEGDTVELPDGSERTWRLARAAQNGRFEDPELRGGYACASFESPCETVMLLEARGHDSIYVNGVLRGGDPYDFGNMVYPALLRKGTNRLLAKVGRRGGLSLQLRRPDSGVFFNLGDETKPDVIEGESGPLWAAAIIVNAQSETLRDCTILTESAGAAGVRLQPTRTTVPPIAPFAMRKIGYTVYPKNTDDAKECKVHLVLQRMTDDVSAANGVETIAEAETSLRVCLPDAPHKRTFLSEIDGSVQYYALNPATGPSDPACPPGLFLSLHGAGVEGIDQAGSYGPKSWGHVVAPTNRRRFGFDWEDWGRLDAMEVLELAQQQLETDPQRVYLTGHSMGGHGTWHIGMTFPDRFAAIAPSAGWARFESYSGARDSADESDAEMAAMLRRAQLQSDTLSSLSLNYKPLGVYVLHGDADDNVPPSEARKMLDILGRFHKDFDSHFQPGAGHWWDGDPALGAACVDWAPIFDFFARHKRPGIENVRHVEFHTACPGISARSDWATIEAQTAPLQVSSIWLDCDPHRRHFSGTTQNVARLALDVAPLRPGATLGVEIDGQSIEDIAWPETEGRIWLRREAGTWTVIEKPSPDLKGPHRYGLFKDAFRNRMIFVYGTQGTEEENAWALAKARYDAETFLYRGNGDVDFMTDAEFDPEQTPGRNVILYGNADTNEAWGKLLRVCPVQVRRGLVLVGDLEIPRDDMAVMFIYPRPDSDAASVGVVAGSGPKGMRLVERMPYFISGVAYPDVLVTSPDVLSDGAKGVRVAGFFGEDWRVETGEFLSGYSPATNPNPSEAADPYRLPKAYLCARADKPIEIDGVLAEKEWGNALWTTYSEDIEGDAKPKPRLKTHIKMLWDDDYFYVAAEMEEPHVWATVTKRNAVIFEDNDFEVFIDPNGDRENYFEFEMNALNTVWNILLDRTYRDGSTVRVREMEGQMTGVDIQGTLNDPTDTDTGWTVEMAFPWKGMAKYAGQSTPPREGDQWRANFSRVEWRVNVVDGKYVKVPRAESPEDNWIWSPQGAVDMHRPETWGYVQFTNQPVSELAIAGDWSVEARHLLRQVHFRQQLFQWRHLRYARDLAELGLEGLSHPSIVAPIEMAVWRDGFEIKTEIGRPGADSQRIRLGRDARFVIE